MQPIALRVYATSVEDDRLIVMGSYDDAKRRTLFSRRPRVTYVKEVFDYNTGDLLEQIKIKSADIRMNGYIKVGQPRLFKKTARKTNDFKAEARHRLKTAAARVCAQFSHILLYRGTLEEVEEKLSRKLATIDVDGSEYIQAGRHLFSERAICTEYNLSHENQTHGRKEFYHGPIVNLPQEDAMRFHAWRLGADAVADYQPELRRGMPVRFVKKNPKKE